MIDGTRKTTREFWESTHRGQIRLRLPSRLNVATGDILRLLERRVRAGARVLEVGFAPGKILAYVARRLGGVVHGIDYSERGVASAQRFFDAMQIEAELRCEDFFETSFAPDSFDFVYSIGLIEHFDDPRPIVRRHVEMVRPGGTVMVAIPNYGGLYGRLQRWLDPVNLGIHNLGLMSKEALEAVGPTDLCARVEARAAGRLSPWIINLHCLLPRRVAQGVSLSFNAIGLMQPIEIPALCPMLVLDLTRRR